MRPYLSLLILLLAGFLFGCSGGDQGNTQGNPLGPQPPVNEFVLKANVRELGSDTTVLSVGADQIVLGGNVAGIEPGQILIQNQGDLTFARTVVSVTPQADGSVVIATTTPSLTDIFASANIRQDVQIDPAEIAAQLDPGIPGLTITEAETPSARGEQSRLGATSTLLTFQNAPLYADYGDAGRSEQPFATLNGQLYMQAGFLGGLDIRDGRLSESFVPYCLVQTGAQGFSVTFHDDSPSGASLDITNRGTFTLPQLGPLSQSISFGLGCQVTGNIDPDVSFTLNSSDNGTIDFNGTPTEGSLVVLSPPGPPSLQSTMRLTSPPPVQSVVDCDLSLITMGVTYVRADSYDWSFTRQVSSYSYYLEPLRIQMKTEPVSGNVAGFSLTPRQLADFHLSTSYTFTTLGITGFGPGGLIDYGPPLEHPLIPNAPLFIPFEDASPQRIRIQTPARATTDVFVGEEIDLVALGLFADGSQRGVACQWAVVDANTTRETQAVTLTETQGRRVRLRVREASPTPVDVICQHSTGPSGRLQLRVNPARVQSVSVAQVRDESTTMDVNETREFAALATYTDGTVLNVTEGATWTSTGPQVIEMQKNLGTGVARGSAEVQATFDGVVGGLTMQVRYPVVLALRLLETLPDPLAVNQTVGLNVLAYLSDGSIQNVTSMARFFSGDSSVATVANGFVTGVARGFTWIYAAYEGFTNFLAVEVGDARLLSIELALDRPDVATGGTARLTATGRFANGAEADISRQVRWVSLDPTIASVDETGLVTGVSTGEALIQAAMGQAVSQIRVPVTGASVLAITAAPTQVTPGGTFSLTAQIQDLQGNLQSNANNQVSISLGTNPAGGTLSGTLTRNAVGGQVTFDDLSLDQAGSGYTLVVSSPLLASATSAGINVSSGGGADVGFLFVANHGGAQPGLQSSLIRFDGSLVLNGANQPTNVEPTDLQRLGNTLYAAVFGGTPAVGKVTRFAIDAAGTLTNQGSSGPGTNHLNGPLQLASNGLNALFLLQAGPNQVTAMLTDATGAIVQQVSQSPVGAASLFGIDAFRSGTTDLVFVGDQGFGSSNDLWVLSYDRSVNPPTLSNGTQVLTPAVPGTVQSLRVLGSRLYMGSNAVNSTITRYDIAGGTLTNEANAFTYTGVGVVFKLFPATHPTLGQLMLVAHRAPNGLSLFRVEANGDLTQLDDVTVGNTPLDINTATLADGTMVVYVSTSLGVEAFLVDGTSGALSTHPGSPFTGFTTPWGLSR